jgi:hypothetical protein
VFRKGVGRRTNASLFTKLLMQSKSKDVPVRDVTMSGEKSVTKEGSCVSETTKEEDVKGKESDKSESVKDETEQKDEEEYGDYKKIKQIW